MKRSTILLICIMLLGASFGGAYDIVCAASDLKPGSHSVRVRAAAAEREGKRTSAVRIYRLVACAEAVGVERGHLKLYASFDKGVAPEIALDGWRIKSPVGLPKVEGRYGGAVAINRKNAPDDLVYRAGENFGTNGWTLALWLCMDEDCRAHYADTTYSRGVFSTNGGDPNRGGMLGVFTCWAEFLLNRHPKAGEGKSVRTMVSSCAVPRKRWTHVAYVFRPDGTSDIYFNGNVASCSERNRVKPVLCPVESLRVGACWGADKLDGAVDELKVFDKALAPDEVKEAMESLPLRRTSDIGLYLPCDGEIAGRGLASFSAVSLVFADGFSDDGVKIVRHGYDRCAILSVAGLEVGQPACSCFTYFKPDWKGDEPADVRHGILATGGRDFFWTLEKNAEGLVYAVSSSGREARVVLEGVDWKKPGFLKLAAGYDFDRGTLFVAADDKCATAKLDVPRPARRESIPLIVGDVRGADYYSMTQAEGTLDEILVVRECLSLAALAEVVETEIAKKAKKDVVNVVNAPVSAEEARLWDLAPAERRRTATRETITLNALWRFQLTDAKRSFDANDWIYLPVPGRYSGQENGGAEVEFFLRDKAFRKLSIDTYDGRATFGFTSAWFERAFKADPAWKGRDVTLKIDELSVSQSGIVFLNGKPLAKLVSGGQFFEVPVPEHLLRFDGWNYLTINALDSGGRWTWRGVKGDVALEIANAVRIAEPEVVTSVRDGEISLSAKVVNASSRDVDNVVEAEILGECAPGIVKVGKVRVKAGMTGQVKVRLPWKDAKLWDIDSPNLYRCVFRLRDGEGRLCDELAPFDFGFRELAIRGRDFLLNGRKIHLFIHDIWMNGTDLDTARKTAGLFKDIGYNAIRMDLSGQEQRHDNILRACDEAGLLYFPNVRGVSGATYTTWSNPETRALLDEQMRALVLRWRNHASAAMWYMSVNFLGYDLDCHPLRIADDYEEPAKRDKYLTCLEGVKILRKYDGSARPYFFQAGGNFGEVQTSNAYFCWWPQQERERWPQEWERRAEKPMVPIETSFPYARSFFGMDLQSPGAKPLFFFENLARYYGPKAYEIDDPDMLAQTVRSAKGEAADVWYDSPGLQKLKGFLLTDTLKFWRDFDLSGVCPFEELSFAFGRHHARHAKYSAKRTACPERDYRRFGFTPDAVKVPYQNDVNPALPLPVRDALKRAFAPEFAFFDGGDEEPTDSCRHYRGGSRLSKRLVLINDTRTEVTFSGSWTFGERREPFAKTVAPGGKTYVAVDLELPKVDRKTRLVLSAEVHGTTALSVDPLAVTVCPEPSAKGLRPFSLYDPVGKSAAKLRALDIPFVAVRSVTDAKTPLLVVGAEALDETVFGFALPRVKCGELRVLVMAQRPETLDAIGVGTMSAYVREAFDAEGRELGHWAGKGLLAPDRPVPEVLAEPWKRKQFYHWSNQNVISSYPVLRPRDGGYEAVLVCGKDLVYSPLIEIGCGKGLFVFCQLEIENRTEADVQADALLVKLLAKHAAPNPPRRLFAKVVGADRAAAYGVTVASTNVQRFTVAPAGADVFASLSARDRFFRRPLRMDVFSGPDVTPLVEPAFAAVREVGGERVVLLGIPEDVLSDDFARGEKAGAQSSRLWAAETQQSRLGLIRSLLERAAGAEPDFPASGWKSTYHTEQHVTW